MHRFIRVGLATMGGLALLLAACAPAAESEGATTTDSSSSVATSTDTTTGNSGSEIVLPAESQPSATETDTSTETAMGEEVATSVSGIPLDPDAKTGGVFHTSGSRDNQWLVWEQCCANEWHSPLHVNLVRYRTWGDVDDFKAGAFNQVVPDVAYAWEQSEDGMQWTFQLRDGVAFSDGQPLTCEDVAWSLELNRTGDQLNTSPRGAHIAPVEQFRCADDATLVVDMKRPKPALLQMLALAEFAILPKHIYDGDMDRARSEPNVGAGPFVLQEWLAGEKTTYVRNDNFYDAPFPYLDGMDVAVIRQTAAGISALRAGRIDRYANQTMANIQIMEQECGLCYSFPVVGNTGQTYALIPNMERYPWNLPEVRTALSLAIDRPQFLELAGTASSLPTGGLFLPGSGWEMPYERIKQIPGYDLERPREEVVAEAQALLASAGFGPGELSFVHPAATSPNYVPDAIAMVDMLGEVGIEMKIEEVDRGPYYDAMASGNFDVGGHKGYFRGTDPDGLFYEFYYPGSDRNYGRYSSEEAKQLIDLQSQTLDLEKRKEIAWDAAELILRDVVRTFTGFSADRTFFNKRVHNVMPGPVAMAGHWKQGRHIWLDQ